MDNPESPAADKEFMKRIITVIIAAIVLSSCGGSRNLSTEAPGPSGSGASSAPQTVDFAEGAESGGAVFPAFESSAGHFEVPGGLTLRWPIDREPLKISSTFGPREKASEGSRPDFHRGIDIPGDLGEGVFAVAEGRIYKVVEGGESSEGGNVVTLEHDLPSPLFFHGQEVTRYYSQYSHLDAFGPKAQAWLNDPEATIEVAFSEAIGTLGQSGTTTFNHVHFEIRLQTNCSLEYQVDHPDTLCADYGFDPHVNPFQFLVENDHAAPEIVSIVREGDSLSVTAGTGPFPADFDFAVLQVLDAGGALVFERRIGLNAREGFDATGVDALDEAQQDGFFVDPAPFGSASPVYEISFRFDLADLPALPAATPGQARIVLEDVWGNAASAYFILSK